MEATLGTRIAAHRKNLGMTQDKLAEQLGVTAQAVSKWEHDLSCPDVTMLPRLAEIFGTTTDALLGMEEPVREAEVVTPETLREEAESKGIHFENDHFNISIGNRGSIGFALWMLLFGGLLAASSILQWDIGWWSLCWPSCLLVLGLSELCGGFSIVSLGMVIFGGYFLAGNFFPMPFGKGLILPIMILLAGLSLLVDALRKPNKPHFTVSKGNAANITRKTFQFNGETFTSDVSFGEARHRIDLPRLSGGEASVSFGALTVDLRDVETFAPECNLVLSCSFGELNLLVPKTCRIEHQDSSSFGNVSVKGRPNEDASSQITLDCSANFGEIEITYI